MHHMKKKLKDELDRSKNKIENYVCLERSCGKIYSALDVLQLTSNNSEDLHCEQCKSKLVAESDTLADEEIGDGHGRHRVNLKDMLQRMEEQLKPLSDQLLKVKDLAVPYFGTLQEWEANANGADSPGGTPFVMEAEVEVVLPGIEAKEENITSESNSTSMKILPLWTIKQGMNHLKERRGFVTNETKIDTVSQPDDKEKQKVENEDEKCVQDQLQDQDKSFKAYYESDRATTSERKVGLKAKRVEWQEAGLQDEVALSGIEAKEENIESESKPTSMKILPPWVIKQGMNFLKEEKCFQNESVKAHCESDRATTSERKVGLKAKREDDEYGDVEWQQAFLKAFEARYST